MDKKSKILLVLVVLVAIAAISYTYRKTVSLNDFERMDTGKKTQAENFDPLTTN